MYVNKLNIQHTSLSVFIELLVNKLTTVLVYVVLCPFSRHTRYVHDTKINRLDEWLSYNESTSCMDVVYMHALHVIYSMEYRMLYCHRRLMYFFSTERKNSTDDDSIFIFRRLSCNLFSNRRFRRFRSTQRSS